jgi:hypothetical protein
MLGDGNKPKANEAAKADPAPAANNTPAATPATEAPKSADAKPADSKPADGKPVDAKASDTPAETPKEAPKPAAPAEPVAPPPDLSDPNRIAQPWEKMKNPPATMADVTDPKSYGEVKWPEGVDDAKKAELRGLVADVVGGGKAGLTAKRTLEKAGYEALFALVEGMQGFDYKSAEVTMTAGELNELIEAILGGGNANFSRAEATETIAPAKAQWNASRVKAWLNMLARIPTKDDFRKKKAEIAKQAADDK